MRINKHDATDMTSIGPDPGVVGINWVDVVLASETGKVSF